MKVISDRETDARVCGVVVTYNPDLSALQSLLASVTPQVSNLIIVDNGSDTDLRSIANQHNVELLALGDNFGIAHAQNAGIAHARDCSAEFVLLLDQDSIPADDMVNLLAAAFSRLEHQGERVAAVGPAYIDHRQGETASFVYLSGLSLKRRPCPDPLTIVEADFLIASGSLLPLSAIDQIGDMIEDMFIDYVDIEWGLRARHQGLLCFGVCGARMEHALGDDWISYRGRQIPSHSPLRHYYHLRNAVWLARKSWLPKAWVFVLLWRTVRQFAFFSIFAPNGLAHARMMTIGIWHGVTGRMGRK